MTPDENDRTAWWHVVGMSPLLRAAWRAYGDVVRTRLAAEGFDDLPRNGAYVIGAVARGSLTVNQLPTALGVTKQAFSALVDALVTRGYVRRQVDPDDRRRVLLTLTDRGGAVSEAIDDCAARSDTALLDRVSTGDVAITRRVLGAMTSIPSDVGMVTS